MSLRYKVNGQIIDIPMGGGEGGNANVWQGTLAEYQEEEESIEDGTVILINDDMPSAAQLSATAVSYDNTKSELESDNVQDAINNISNNLIKYKLGEFNIGEEAQLPSNFNELYLYCFVDSNNEYRMMSINLRKEFLSNKKLIAVSGYPYGNSVDDLGIAVDCYIDKIIFSFAHRNTVPITNGKMVVYYTKTTD